VSTPGFRAGLRNLRQLVPLGGTMYHGAQYLTAVVEVDPEKMQPFLPFGVRLAKPYRADLFTAYFPDNVFGSHGYHEAGLFVHIETVQGRGIHCPWMILDDDVALIMGRELLGYPKKLGEIGWNIEDDTVDNRASRRGSELFTMRGTLGEVVHDAPKILGRPHRNVMGLMGASLPRVVAFTPGERPLEVRRAHLDIEIFGSERDPLHEMGLGRVVESRLHTVDLTTPWIPPIPIRPLTPFFTMSHFNPRVH
jgi:acetoacetate decarboxylase